jgi:hypothetical protein
MKILHTMLSCFYIDNAAYQENLLTRQNMLDGHEVYIIASTEIFLNNNNITGHIDPVSYINEDGIPVIRLAYKNVLNKSISKKIRAYINFYDCIARFSPDIIYFHGISAYALIDVARYKKNNSHVKLIVDSHSDSNNSATNIFSKYLLHKFFYKTIIKSCIQYIDKIYYITLESKLFLRNMYDISENRLEYLPLGGKILSKNDILNLRKKVRNKLSINSDDLVLIHTGKMDKNKRTIEILQAFNMIESKNIRLILIGSIADDLLDLCKPLIESDQRIINLGWVDSNVLHEYLGASDLYVQLGSQSVTMQQSLCSGCAAALYPFDSHLHLLDGSVFYIKNSNDLQLLVNSILADRSLLISKSELSYSLAKEKLDYKVIASKIY